MGAGPGIRQTEGGGGVHEPALVQRAVTGPLALTRPRRRLEKRTGLTEHVL